MPRPSRRDFIKVGSLVSGALAASRFLPQAALGTNAAAASLPNVIILVFDAMSAKNLSLYGYPRKTTPELERFAQHANVYNQHYSAGNFTVPGTASLLTGLYPWTHRAINLPGNLITPGRVGQNIFKEMGAAYHRLAFSQNLWPNFFFGQFEGAIERVLSPGSFSLLDQFPAAAFTGDLANSHRAYDDLLFRDGQPPASLVFGLAHNVRLYETLAHARKQGNDSDLASTANYPIVFRLQELFDGLLKTIAGLPRPFLAYLHVWSPHSPYSPSHEFANLFNDSWTPVSKADHPLGNRQSNKSIMRDRRLYDRYIANSDFEFGRLLDGLQARGILDDSYLVVTSDHGEMMERGKKGHTTPLLYEPIVRIPLIVSAPRQRSRRDINVATCSVDLLPTLLSLSGGKIPAWAEGQVLPGLGGTEQPERSVFACEAKQNHPWQPWAQASYALRKGKYKLTYYVDYPQLQGQDRFELYDVESDPEELNDLYSASSPTAQDLRGELLARVSEENAKFAPVG